MEGTTEKQPTAAHLSRGVTHYYDDSGALAFAPVLRVQLDDDHEGAPVHGNVLLAADDGEFNDERVASIESALAEVTTVADFASACDQLGVAYNLAVSQAPHFVEVRSPHKRTRAFNIVPPRPDARVLYRRGGFVIVARERRACQPVAKPRSRSNGRPREQRRGPSRSRARSPGRDDSDSEQQSARPLCGCGCGQSVPPGKRGYVDDAHSNRARQRRHYDAHVRRQPAPDDERLIAEAEILDAIAMTACPEDAVLVVVCRMHYRVAGPPCAEAELEDAA